MSALQFLAVGDRVRNTRMPHWPSAIVTELTEDGGFKFRSDEPHSIGPRHGTVQEGEVYAAGIEGWERVSEHAAASSPATKFATAHQLRHHADTMERGAREARAMAALVAAMPEPIGVFVIEIARALQPHGLAVVNTVALRMAITALEGFESKDEDTDHKQEADDWAASAAVSLRRSIEPC